MHLQDNRQGVLKYNLIFYKNFEKIEKMDKLWPVNVWPTTVLEKIYIF